MQRASHQLIISISLPIIDNSGSNILTNRDINPKVSSSTTKATEAGFLRLNILSTASTINAGGVTYILTGREAESENTANVVRAVIRGRR